MTEPWWIWVTEMASVPFDLVTLDNSPHMPISMFCDSMKGRAEVIHIVFGPEVPMMTCSIGDLIQTESSLPFSVSRSCSLVIQHILTSVSA